MKLIQKILFSWVLLGLLPGISQATVIDLTSSINMGFENAPAQGSGNDPKGVNFGGTAWYANSVPVTVNGWTFGQDGTLDGSWGTPQVEWYSTNLLKSWNTGPAQGSEFAVELNSDSFHGRMYAQPVLSGLVVGQAYQINFLLAPERNNGSTAVVNLDVNVQGQDQIFTVASTPNGSAWTAESLTFIAESSSPEIRFYDGIYDSGINTNGNNNVNLDFNTPEPSSLFALVALLIVIGGQWGWKKMSHPTRQLSHS